MKTSDRSSLYQAASHILGGGSEKIKPKVTSSCRRASFLFLLEQIQQNRRVSFWCD